MKKPLLALLALAVSAAPAFAQDKWPTQPIRIVNAFAAGGATDIALRTLAEELRSVLGATVIVENKAGANGLIGIEDVARRPADGYTLLGGPSSMSSGLLTMEQKPSTDFDETFDIVSPIGEGPPSMILVRKEMGIKNWKELVEYSKANPGKVRYASPGALTGPHLDMMLLAHRTGLDWLHVPMKGGGGILNALTVGDANIGLLNLAAGAPLLQNDTVIPVATSHSERVKRYPDVPTFAEVGAEGVGNTLWHAVWVRADTPDEIKKRLFDAVQKAMKGERMKDLYQKTEMWGPELESMEASATWFKDAMKGFIATAEAAKPLLEKGQK